MKNFLYLISFVVLLLQTGTDENSFVAENVQYAADKYQKLIKAADSTKNRFPRTCNEAGDLLSTDMYDWTSGFFPGSLWYLYEATKDTSFQTAAIKWTDYLEPLKTFKDHHDLGFMMYNSFGNAFRITGDERYKSIVVESARSLSSRFSPVTGSIKSWNSFKSWGGEGVYTFPVIIDNLMNLELLFFASNHTGDSSFRKMAVSHALQTMKNHVRKDYSSFHVVCYNPQTGKVEARETGQGYANNSTWSRGQAWGIYGFTMCYRETRDPRFLKTALGMANYFIAQINKQEDKIPFWDFNANEKGYEPGKNSYANKVSIKYRDASAAAIAASALLELSRFADKKQAALYVEKAKELLHLLSGGIYRSDDVKTGNFLLGKSVGSIPHKVEINVPLVYADYYFIEAMMRYQTLLKENKTNPD